jgi:hypothetical protein
MTIHLGRKALVNRRRTSSALDFILLGFDGKFLIGTRGFKDFDVGLDIFDEARDVVGVRKGRLQSCLPFCS